MMFDCVHTCAVRSALSIHMVAGGRHALRCMQRKDQAACSQEALPCVCCAAPGVNGGTVCELPMGTFAGYPCQLTASQVTALRSNGMYLSVTTTAYPTGGVCPPVLKDVSWVHITNCHTHTHTLLVPLRIVLHHNCDCVARSV